MEVIHLKDGSTEILDGIPDFLGLAGRHMGDEARDWLERCLDAHYTVDTELERIGDEQAKEMERVEEHYQNILRELGELSQELADLAAAPRLDRAAIKNKADQIRKSARRQL